MPQSDYERLLSAAVPEEDQPLAARPLSTFWKCAPHDRIAQWITDHAGVEAADRTLTEIERTIADLARRISLPTKIPGGDTLVESTDSVFSAPPVRSGRTITT